MNTQLEALLPLLPPRARTVFLGVGSRLRGDDYAGMAVIDALASLANHPSLKLVQGATAPENCVGDIRSFAPDAVIVIDAARMGRMPGEYALLSPEEITGATFSTHMLPLPVTLSYLEAACGCTTAYIGIEPSSTGQTIGLCVQVEQGVWRLAEALKQLLSSSDKTPV